MSKAKRDDFRLEEELRSAKAKYEEANEDVFRRMQDIKDAEADSVRDLTRFMDVELDYHERCADAIRQKRAQWSGAGGLSPTDSYGARDRDYGNGASRRPSGRSRSNTAQSGSYTPRSGGGASYGARDAYNDGPAYDDEPDEMPPMRVPIRSQSRVSVHSAASTNHDPMPPARPSVARASTYGAGGGNLGLSRTPSSNTMTPLNVVPPPSQVNVSSLRGQLRPTARPAAMDVFADDDDTASSDTAPGSASPATSYGSSTRGGGGPTTALVGKKAPPPPPSRAKKPPPPVPNRRELQY